MQIGIRLSEIRKKYGYTQKQLADELNMTQQVISNIERNTTTPDINFLQGAADLYKISLDELIGRQVTFETGSSLEKQILSIIEKMDDTGKELSLGLVNQVAKHRGNIDEE
jgi:transcriptional regulator with XRE-family HTH domain